jgi:excisionase family DNA binding protein
MTATLLKSAKAIPPRDAANYLGVSVRTLWTWTNEGRIASHKLGRLVRYTIDDLDAFLAANRVSR